MGMQRFLVQEFFLRAFSLGTLRPFGGAQNDLGPTVVPFVEMFVSLRDSLATRPTNCASNRLDLGEQLPLFSAGLLGDGA
jgi:hypothetical protein